MAEPKTTCTECGVTILVDTAEKNNGKCIPCVRGKRSDIEEGKRWAIEQRERDRINEVALAKIKNLSAPRFCDFLAEEDPLTVLWRFIIRTVYSDQSEEGNVDTLASPTKTIYFAFVFDGEVLNGGFSQFFSNSSGKYAHEATTALNTLGAVHAEALLQRAIAKFPSRKVPKDRMHRYELLEKIDDQLLDALDTEYYALDKDDREDLSVLAISYMHLHASEHLVLP